MNTPEISVIVCNYNHAQYIGGAVNSVLEQSFQNLEVIVVDDGSTDNSKDIINSLVKLDSRIQKPIFLEQNKGKWFALNTAIATARGKLITLQDADDSSHPERLLRQHEVLTAHNSYHNLCGFKHCYNQQDIEAGKSTILPPSKVIMNHKDVLLKVYQGKRTPGINHYFVGNDYEVHGASCLFHKSLWENGMKFLPGNLGLRVQKAEDSDFNTKMTLLLQKTSVLREPLYLYRRNTSTNNAWLENL